jgi:hypothetical protein
VRREATEAGVIARDELWEPGNSRGEETKQNVIYHTNGMVTCCVYAGEEDAYESRRMYL